MGGVDGRRVIGVATFSARDCAAHNGNNKAGKSSGKIGILKEMVMIIITQVSSVRMKLNHVTDDFNSHVVAQLDRSKA